MVGMSAKAAAAAAAAEVGFLRKLTLSQRQNPVRGRGGWRRRFPLDVRRSAVRSTRDSVSLLDVLLTEVGVVDGEAAAGGGGRAKNVGDAERAATTGGRWSNCFQRQLTCTSRFDPFHLTSSSNQASPTGAPSKMSLHEPQSQGHHEQQNAGASEGLTEATYKAQARRTSMLCTSSSGRTGKPHVWRVWLRRSRNNHKHQENDLAETTFRISMDSYLVHVRDAIPSKNLTTLQPSMHTPPTQP
jgi:hypothetical protein